MEGGKQLQGTQLSAAASCRCQIWGRRAQAWASTVSAVGRHAGARVPRYSGTRRSLGGSGANNSFVLGAFLVWEAESCSWTTDDGASVFRSWTVSLPVQRPDQQRCTTDTTEKIMKIRMRNDGGVPAECDLKPRQNKTTRYVDVGGKKIPD